MKLKFILLQVLFIIISCSSVNNTKSDELHLVSLIQIINNQDEFDGKKVRVQGYFILAFEENVLYLSKTDYENYNSKNGIWLSVSKEFVKSQNIEPPYKGYVVVEGVFRKDRKGITSLYNGNLDDIEYISRISGRIEN